LANLPASQDNQAAYLAALRQIDNHQDAAQSARELITAGETYPEYHPLLLGQIALSLAKRDPQLACRTAQDAVSACIRNGCPNSALYHALNAYVSGQAEEDSQSQLNSVEALLALWDDEPYWHGIAADLLINKESTSEEPSIQSAISHLEKVTHFEPLKSSYYQKLGEAHLVAKNLDAAIHTLKQATRLSPNDHAPWINLARAYWDDGDSEQADKCAKQALRLAPNEPAPRLLLAEFAIQEGAHQKAHRYTADILKTHPQHPQALLLQAEALTNLDRPAEALSALETATARLLPSTQHMLKIVELKRRVHGEKAALQALQALQAQYNDDALLAIRLAHSLAQNGQELEAIQQSYNILKNEKYALSSDQRAQLLLLTGRLLRLRGQLDQSIEQLAEAIDHSPDWVEPYIELGRTFHERRQYPQALQTYQQAIAITPNDVRLYYWAGLALKDSKDYANAEIMLRKAADLDPEDIGIHRKLGAVVALNLVHNRSEKAPIKTS
jgi:tetratricopeptide (TPR) repeat protein